MPQQRNRYGDGSIFTKGDRWYGRIRLGDKQPKKSLGLVRSPQNPKGLTEKQARAELRKWAANYKAPAPGSEALFIDVANAHISRKQAMGLTERTIYDYRLCLKNHFEPEFRSRAIGSISAPDVDRLQQKMLRKLSKKSVKIYMTILNGIFVYAMKQGLRTDNPCAGVERPKLPKESEIRVLFSAELEAVLSEIPGDVLGAVDRRLYYFAAKSGLRQAECCKRLRWRHLDFKGRTIRVLGKTKSGRGRTVPMAADVKAMLEAWRDESIWDKDDDLVFAHPGTGQHIDATTILKRFQRCVRKAGVGEFELRQREGKEQLWPKTTFHDLRHSFATACAMAGVPIPTIKEWLGHADIQTTMIYSHYVPTEHEADVLDRAFGNPVGGAQIGAQSTISHAQDEATATN